MKQIEINEMYKYIDASPIEMNLMFVGDTGIGKTTAIENYCKERGIYLKTLILSQIDASESLGIPVKAKRQFRGVEYETLDTAIPSWVFDLAEHENAMLFLDEFLCAQPSVMNAFLNFLTQKNVHGIDLSHVKVIAATNIGNYTFDPDSNILSRFCFFYTVNTKAAEYVKETRIHYVYHDENPRSGTLFNERSLKPRCLEQLSKVSDGSLFFDYYEGFTNRMYFNIHPNENFNTLLYPYFKVVEGSLFELSRENAICVKSILKSKYPRIKNWENQIAQFINLTPESVVILNEVFFKMEE